MNRRVTPAGLLAVVVMAAIPIAASGQVRPRPPIAKPPAPKAETPVEIRTAVNRTAVWVGDRVTYTIEFRCAPGVDLLLDDLAKERLAITGGEIIGLESDRGVSPAGRAIHRMRLTLVTHAIDAAAITMAAIPVRYYAATPGQRASSGAPAGQVTVPPLAVAVRSTLPATNAEIALRPPAELRPAPAYLRLAEPIGLALVIVAILPLVLGNLDLARRVRAFRSRHHERRARKTQRGSFAQIRELEPMSDTARIEAYERLDTFLRDHLDGSTGIAARSLTPVEVQHAVESRAPWLTPHDVGGLLDACERARYDREPPTADDWREAVRRAEEVVTARR
jgi:hypothetical protein